MKLYKWWAVFSKAEMTKLWIDGSFVPVTLLKLLDQEIIRFKTVETDGYNAVVIWVNKFTKWEKTSFKDIMEYRTDDTNLLSWLEIGQSIDTDLLEGMKTIGLTTISKGKWFQGPIKRHNTHGMPATHGHKFTRVLGSMGNRKPRRTMRWHPGSGQMGLETTSLRSIKLVDRFEIEGKKYIAVKWSVPGRKNNLIKVYFH